MEIIPLGLVGEKRRRTLSAEQRPYSHSRNWEQKGNGLCETGRIQRPDGPIQWECRTCSNVEEPQLSQPTHTDDQAETTIKKAEQTIESLQSQAIDFEEDPLGGANLVPESMTSHSDSDSESATMTYYTDSDSDLVLEPTKYSSVANAAAKTVLGNNENHETAHLTDAITSLDESPTDAELSLCKEETDSRHQAQPVAGNSILIDERDQTQETSDVPEGFASAQIETLSQAATGPTMVSDTYGIARLSYHEEANKGDHVRDQFQQLGTFRPCDQLDSCGPVEGMQNLRWMPLVQPSDKTNIDNGTGQEGTSSQPSNIVIHISSDAYPKEICNQRNASLLESSLKQADPPSTSNPPPYLEPGPLSFATLMLQKLVPPPSATSPAYTLRPSTLLPLTPRSHLPSTSLTSQGIGLHTTSDNLQTSNKLSVLEIGIGGGFSTKNPSLSFQFDSYLTKIGAAPSLYGRDLTTAVPSLEHLDDEIINEYLQFLVQFTNARSQRDMPNTRNKIAMIGSTDIITQNILKGLATFSTILVPIKVRHQRPTDVPPHWLLAVLYPRTLEQTHGRAEIYDSHEHWIKNVMTANNVFQFLKSRLKDEFHPADWTLISQQFSQPQHNEVDSGLFVLANAKSIALSLEMLCLDSDKRSMSLRRRIAGELASRSIVAGLFRAPKNKRITGVRTTTRPRAPKLRYLKSKGG